MLALVGVFLHGDSAATRVVNLGWVFLLTVVVVAAIAALVITIRRLA